MSDVCFVLDKHAKLDFHSASWLKKGQRVNISLHLNTLISFSTNQSLLLLLTDACLTKKHTIPIVKSLIWPHWGSNPWSIALEVSALTITPPMWHFAYSYDTNQTDLEQVVLTSCRIDHIRMPLFYLRWRTATWQCILLFKFLILFQLFLMAVGCIFKHI
jgi:hypothetical protein